MGCLSTILSRAIFLRSADPSNLVYAEDDENAIAAAIEEHRIRQAREGIHARCGTCGVAMPRSLPLVSP